MTASTPENIPSSVRLRDVVTTPARESAYIRAALWDDVTVVDRLRGHSVAHPNSVAIVDEASGRQVTFAELERDSRRVAGFLVDNGVQVGDVVAIQMPNWYCSVAIAIGSLMAGAVVNPMLPIYRARELRHMLAVGRTKVIFTPGTYRGFDHFEMVQSLRSDLRDLSRHVVVEPDPDSFERLFPQELRQLPEVSPSWVCELMFTSGTEAEPKAVMHTERTLTANARATWKALEMEADEVVWMPAPIGHSTGFNHGMRLAIYHGLKLVLQDRWDPVAAAQLVERERCTHTLLATTFLRDLTHAAREGRYDVSSLRLFGCGGAPVPSEVVREAAEQGIGCLRLYGATEVLVATWNRPDAPESKRLATDGPALDGVEIEVRDEEGNAVLGEPGELFTRSPSGCVGFFNDSVRTAATFTEDGWFRSGDVGVIDSEGYFTIVGRKKEIIIRGGLNIAPREVEEMLMTIPGVRAAAVLGVPDHRLGEITCACVVLDEGIVLTLAEVVAQLRAAGLATFKLPERLEVLTELPSTATGKVRKHLIAAALAEKDARLPRTEA